MPARQKSARVWVEVHLTRGEIRELKDRAYADRRAIGRWVAWAVAQALNRSAPRRPRPRQGGREPRVPYSIGFRLPPVLHARLVAAARKELRSISNYVEVVVGAALRRKK